MPNIIGEKAFTLTKIKTINYNKVVKLTFKSVI